MIDKLSVFHGSMASTPVRWKSVRPGSPVHRTCTNASTSARAHSKWAGKSGAYHGLRRLRWRGTVAKMEEAAAPIDPVRDMPIL
jgi:hypothetical protein